MYLAAETRQEAGDIDGKTSDAIRCLNDLFDFYERTFRQRSKGFILIYFVRVNKVLTRAREKMLKGASIETIHDVGSDLARFCESLHEKYFGRMRNYVKGFIQPDDQLAAEADLAIQQFHQRMEEFQNSKTFSAAHSACIQSRLAGGKLHCAWTEYREIYFKNPDQVKSFCKDLQQLHDLMETLSKNAQSDEAYLLAKYSRSVERRINSLDALRKDDRLSIWRTLHDAVEEPVSA